MILMMKRIKKNSLANGLIIGKESFAADTGRLASGETGQTADFRRRH